MRKEELREVQLSFQARDEFEVKCFSLNLLNQLKFNLQIYESLHICVAKSSNYDKNKFQ